MPTTVTLYYDWPYASIEEGPSRTKLLLTLFDRERPDTITFTVTHEGRRQRVQVWLSGLSHYGENSWEFEGRMTNDSPFKHREFVVGVYNDYTRTGSFNKVDVES